jgi:hypothetical protein
MGNLKEKAMFVASVAAAVAVIAFIQSKYPIPVVGAYLPKASA